MYSILRFVLPMIVAVSLAMPAVTHAFSDVPDTHPAHAAIQTLSQKKIISGYADGSFQPNTFVSRAEFMKMVVTAMGGIPKDFKETSCFTDVAADAWYAPYVCYGKSKRFVSTTSSTFAPAQHVNMAEATKIATLAFQVTPITSQPDKAWYVPFLQTLSTHNYIPQHFSHTGQVLRRGDAAELLWRVVEQKKDLPTRALADIKDGMCTYDTGISYGTNIDEERVRNAWLNWHNTERRALGLPAYTYNIQLDRTAMNWSNTAKQRGYIDHKRAGTTAYYDYRAVGNWFRSQGVQFIGGGTPYTESIGWGTYSCSQTDCTDALIASIKSTHSFFMSEKGKAYRPHYNAIASRTFKEIGLGIVIDPAKRRYYLTVHYGTRLAGSSSICGM